MRRVVRGTSRDESKVEVRQGDRVLGQVGRLGTEADDTVSGAFTHAPAWVDHAPRFLALDRALAKNDAADVARHRGEIDGLGIAVWNTEHDMRIDAPGTLTIAAGRVRFRPNDAYLMLRTGGL